MPRGTPLPNGVESGRCGPARTDTVVAHGFAADHLASSHVPVPMRQRESTPTPSRHQDCRSSARGAARGRLGAVVADAPVGRPHGSRACAGLVTGVAGVRHSQMTCVGACIPGLIPTLFANSSSGEPRCTSPVSGTRVAAASSVCRNKTFGEANRVSLIETTTQARDRVSRQLAQGSMDRSLGAVCLRGIGSST